MHTQVFATALLTGSLLACPWSHEAPVHATTSSVGAPQTKSTETIQGITAAKDVQAVIEEARRALGVQRVRSLFVKGTVTVGDGRPDTLERFLLLPDSFKELDGGITFTLSRDDYWQVPEPDQETKAKARKATWSKFMEQCLVWLLRAPRGFPLKATWADDASSGRQAILFEGPDGFRRVVAFDAASHRPVEYASTGVITQAGTTVGRSARRAMIDEYGELDGIRLPRRITLRVEGMHGDTVYAFGEMRVNAGVTPADFTRR